MRVLRDLQPVLHGVATISLTSLWRRLRYSSPTYTTWPRGQQGSQEAVTTCVQLGLSSPTILRVAAGARRSAQLQLSSSVHLNRHAVLAHVHDISATTTIRICRHVRMCCC